MTENVWYITILFVAWTALAIWAERRTTIGKRIGATTLCIIGGMLFVNLKMCPSWSPVHAAVFSYLVPVAIPILLFTADIRKVVRIAKRFIPIFLVGALGTVLGGFIGGMMVPIGVHTWKAYGMYVGTYIGGSLNLAAVGSALQADPNVFVAINAADVVAFLIFTIICFQAPRWGIMRRLFPYPLPAEEAGVQEEEAEKRPSDAVEIGIVLAAAVACGGIGELLGKATGLPGVAFSTALAVALASTTQIGRLAVASEIGTFMLHIFMTVIGAISVLSEVINAGPAAFGGACVVILVHLVVILTVGKLMKQPVESILLASNANVGGPSTAAALATGLGWKGLVLPGVLIGILGYAVGTYLGLGVAYSLKAILGM